MIYFDHNATTPLHSEVKKEIIDTLNIYGNASSAHPLGFEAREKIETIRENMFQFLGADEGRIIFTSGGSESNNLVLKSYVRQQTICGGKKLNGRPHVITTTIEHPSILNTVTCLKNLGADVTKVPVDAFGQVDPDDVMKAVQSNTTLVSVMLANNEVGTIQPIAEIGSRLREKEIAFHCDAIQAIGKVPVSVSELKVDCLSISGHKINATKGIGALFLGKSISLCPLIHGGHQELNLRAGTENNLGIFALGKAIEVIQRSSRQKIDDLQKLRDSLHKQITESIEDVHLNGHPTERLSGTLNLSFDKIEGAALVELAGTKGVAMSSGSACTSFDDKASHVLTAMKMPDQQARSSVRMSLGYGNTQREIDEAVEIIAACVNHLRAISPL